MKLLRKALNRCRWELLLWLGQGGTDWTVETCSSNMLQTIISYGNKLINNKRKWQFYRCVLKEEPHLYPADTVPNMLSHGSASFLDFLERLCCGVMSLQEGSGFKFSQGQELFCMFSHIYALVLTSHSSASGSKLPIGVNMPSNELSTCLGWILMLASCFREQECIDAVCGVNGQHPQ